MKALEKILFVLFPTLLIKARWRGIWDQTETSAVLVGSRVLFLLASSVYLAHWAVLDSRMNLNPEHPWSLLRIASFAPAMVGLLLTFTSNFKRTRYCRLPLFVYGLWCTYLQGVSMQWFSGHHYMISIIVAIIAVIPLRLSIVSSICYMLAAYATEYTGWASRPEDLTVCMSMAGVGLVLVGVIRSRILSEVQTFIAERTNLETQARLIETEMEMNEQIRTYLPREIYKRFEKIKKNHKLNALQAMEEVVRPRKAKVTCLYTDIRGFTKLTRESGNFVQERIIPNSRLLTDQVEERGGIPKLFGDLLFAYFDGNTEEREILKAALTAFDLLEATEIQNIAAEDGKKIRRFILLSSGEAVVGNLGGTEGSRDITVIGDVANIPSRIDPLTKNVKFLAKLGEQRVIMTDSFAKDLKLILPDLVLNRIELMPLGLCIRDFPEETLLWSMETSSDNKAKLEGKLTSIAESKDSFNLQPNNLLAKQQEALG